MVAFSFLFKCKAPYFAEKNKKVLDGVLKTVLPFMTIFDTNNKRINYWGLDNGNGSSATRAKQHFLRSNAFARLIG